MNYLKVKTHALSLFLRMRFLYFIIIIVLFGFGSAFAQRTCGSTSYAIDEVADDPSIANRRALIEQHTQLYITNHKKTRTLVTIPVVFHVVYNTPAQNIPDSLILAQLSQLNLDYARTNADTVNTPAPFKLISGNTDIQFCLAVRDPQGQATNGITRTPTTLASFSQNNNVKYTANGGKDAWPTTDYLNVWICNLGNSLLGYAQFPGGSAATDGVVVLYTSVGSTAKPNTDPTASPYDLGRSLTHEAGHWLNLYHIWGDDNGACSGSDQVNDSPNQANSNYGCPTYPFLDACATANPGAMFMNYMDYVDDNCMNAFSLGQGQRMQALFASGGARQSLMNSLGCVPLTPCTNTPISGNAVASADTLCGGTKTISLVGSTLAPGITFQWQQATAPNGLYSAALGANTNSNYIASATSGTMYYRCIVTCSFSNLKDTSNSIAVNSFGVSGVSGGTLCTAGTLTLNATGIGTVNWFTSPTSTTPVFTGNPYITSVTGNTTFFANVGTSTSYSVGPVSYSFGSTSTSTSFTNGEVFVCNVSATIDTVFAYPSGAGNIVVTLIDSTSNAVVSTYTLPVTATQTNTKVAIPVNFACNAGVVYKMYATGSTVPSLYRNTNGATHPYTVPGIISILHTGNNQLNSYRYFYDWRLRAGCQTPFVGVPVTLANPTITITQSNPLCNGATGSITANAGPNFNYTINGSNPNSSGIYNNLSAGTYTITAASSTGCSSSTIVTISQPTGLSLNLTSTTNTLGCNGSIAGVINGGVSPYIFSINNGSGPINGGPTFNNLCTGTYTYCVTDANGCLLCSTQIINSQNSIGISNQITTSCQGSNSGSISSSVVGGTAPYSFQLNGGPSSTNGLFSNLAAGTYTIMATDANNLVSTATAVVGLSNLSVSSSATTSNANCNGSATATATGGVGPYAYIWSNAATTATINYLCVGNYSVCAIDANGCSNCATANVLAGASLSITLPNIVQACAGTLSGSIVAQASNGTGPYLYQIDGASFVSTNSFAGLAPGIYTITAKDNINATASTIVDLTLSANLSLATNQSNILCHGTCTGNISAVSAGGVAAYSYSVNGGGAQSNGVFNNLCAGIYTVTGIDGNGCSNSSVITITEPQIISIIQTTTNIKCNGNNDGSVSMIATGGLAPYTYSVNSGQFTTNATFSGLAPGTYAFVVKDAFGCTSSISATVTSPPTLVLNTVSSPNNGSIIANPTGGVTPYSYTINNGVIISSNTFNALTAGIYTITVIDANGCKSTNTTILQAPENVVQIELIKALNIYPNPNNGVFTLNINSNNIVGLLKLRIIDALGKTIHTDIINVQGTTAKKEMALNFISKGNYTLVVQDEHNAKVEFQIIIQ